MLHAPGDKKNFPEHIDSYYDRAPHDPISIKKAGSSRNRPFFLTFILLANAYWTISLRVACWPSTAMVIK